MRYGLLLPCLLACSVNTAVAQVSIGIGLPSVSIGISVPVYPELVPVPGYPVYYAPQMQSNFFFYDGMYWVYQRDAWYASEWYDGPWGPVEPEFVPLYVLRIPVRYYRDPPFYFRGWISNAPPRWGEHWGNDWERRRNGWDRWDHNARPRLAPLPIYQRQYGGERYPHGEQQRSLRDQNYRYQPRDADVRQHVQDRAPRNAPGQAPQPSQQAQPPQQSQSPRERNGGRPDEQRANPRQPPQPAPQPQQPQSPARGPDRAQPRPPQGAAEEGRRPAPVQAQPQPQPPPQPQPRTPPNTLPPRDVGRPQTPIPPQREAPAPGAGQKTIPRGEALPDQRRGQGAERGQNPGRNQGQNQGQGQGQGRDRGDAGKGEERGQDRTR